MYQQPPLTLTQLAQTPENAVFAAGEVTNDKNGIPMVNIRPGDSLIWVAKTGGIGDWAIYIHWKDKGEAYLLNSGDKITDEKFIRKLVPCTDEAYERYRF